uniref:DUF1848 domain-containing protein n=1 Tax=Acetatifactor sp. TaxID=1872090 RepID=UPI004057A702
MIINSGMRTDIPAYFSSWFYNRIREGYVCVRNPYYPEQVTRYALAPEVVDCLAFCTKNPEPMLDRLEEVSAFKQFWFVTITPYGKEIEPHVPKKEKVLDAFIRLSDMVGVHAVSWRYDPIFISERYSLDYHIESFERMAGKLEGYVDNCVISFIDLYAKTRKNFPGVREVTKAERMTLGKAFVDIGNEHGITIRSCCEGTELAELGVEISGCMTQAIVERAIGCSLLVPAKEKSPRQECSCLMGNDIGMYNTCGHGCLYCYANYDRETVMQNIMRHDPNSPFLIGGSRTEDKVKEAKQVSYLDGQLRFDFGENIVF